MGRNTDSEYSFEKELLNNKDSLKNTPIHYAYSVNSRNYREKLKRYKEDVYTDILET